MSLTQAEALDLLLAGKLLINRLMGSPPPLSIQEKHALEALEMVLQIWGKDANFLEEVGFTPTHLILLRVRLAEYRN